MIELLLILGFFFPPLWLLAGFIILLGGIGVVREENEEAHKELMAAVKKEPYEYDTVEHDDFLNKQLSVAPYVATRKDIEDEYLF